MRDAAAAPSTDAIDDDWESAIRECEEALRAAFLAADLETLDALLTDGYAVNSPLQQVVTKPALLGLLRSGRIRHDAYSFEIEHVNRHGDVAIVMGRDRVVDPPDRVETRRRYTNVWVRQDGRWRAVARHAHATSRERPT